MNDRTNRARRLRNELTDAEKHLWYALRSRQVGGLKFRRQQPIGAYIVDFVCLGKKVVIEVDGGQHASALVYDAKRDQWLASEGFHVLRFWNNDVVSNREAVIVEIMKRCGAGDTLP